MVSWGEGDGSPLLNVVTEPVLVRERVEVRLQPGVERGVECLHGIGKLLGP